MTTPRKKIVPAQPNYSPKPPEARKQAIESAVMVEGLASCAGQAANYSGEIPYTPDIRPIDCKGLCTQVVSDNWTARRMKDISRIGMDRFDDMGDFIASMMDVFEDATRCTVYFAPSNIFADTMTNLEHRITVLRKAGEVTIDESGRNSQRGSFDPVMTAFMKGTPMIFDHDPGQGFEHGMKLVFQNLDRNSDEGEVSKIKRTAGGRMYAVMPFYYKEPDNPSGIVLLEGDLRAKNSRLSGFSRAYWSAHLAMSASAQISLQLIHRFDAITNLPRRLDFELDLKEGIKDVIRRGSNLHILFVDLDRFKSVNDDFTHPVGDEILRQAAEKMQNSVRSVDDVFRVGGEEFGVILDGVSHERALEIAERVRKNVESISVHVLRTPDGKVEIVKRGPNDQAPIPEGAEEVKVTCSIGVTDVKAAAGISTGTELPPNGRGDKLIQGMFDRVYSQSAQLLHEAKNSGRNCVYYVSGNGSAVKALRAPSFS